MDKRFKVKPSIVIVLLLLVLSFVVSSVFAKFFRNSYASDSTRIAKFDYSISGLDENTHVINVFDTALDTGIIGNQSEQKLIAPGTNGNIEVEVENKSEVAIKASFNLTETNTSNIPIVYGFNGEYYSSVLAENDTVKLHGNNESVVTISGDLNDLALVIGNESEINVADGSSNAKKAVNLTWAWAFEGVSSTAQTNMSDTNLGEEGTATVTLRVDCNIEQIDLALI